VGDDVGRRPVIGLDLGPVFRLDDRRTLAVEAVARLGQIEMEGDVGSSYFGVQAAFAWAPGSR
jgi:hypothetical protein